MNFDRVFITKHAHNIMKRETLRTSNRMESGGVLMGYYSRENQVVVTHASPPGPNSIQRKDFIEFDIPYCQDFINQIYFSSKRFLTYIGDWHSHTVPNIFPSPTDKKELKKMSVNPKSRLPFPIMVITYGDKEQLKVCTYGYENKRIYAVPEIIFLEE